MSFNNGLPIFLKWAGGKRSLIPEFVKLFPQKIDKYFEPFLGSGAIFFYLKKQNPDMHAVLSDTNKDLINCFIFVRDKPEDIIRELNKHEKRFKGNSKYYYKMRERFNNSKNKFEKAHLLIFLNKTCFNGLYRVNSKGEFNVPQGSYKHPKICEAEVIMAASKLLKGIDIKCLDYKEAVAKASEGDFVYFDPPYEPISKTSYFNSYTKDSFTFENQKELAKIYRNLIRLGCDVLLSNSKHCEIEKLYPENKNIYANRMINCNGEKRGKIAEIIVSNLRRL
jgi:DNA adenine methylase